MFFVSNKLHKNVAFFMRVEVENTTSINIVELSTF